MMIPLLLAAALAGATPLDEAIDAIHYNDWARAIPLLKAESDRGNPEASRRLAQRYRHGGDGVPDDAREAYKLMLKAERGGDAIATYEVFWALDRGEGVEKSTAAASRFAALAAPRLKAAAEKGDWEAAARLANMYQHGFGAEKNPSESVKWEEKATSLLKALAAKTGDPYYDLYVAFEYRYALAEMRDLEEARKWYKRSADKGYPTGIDGYAETLMMGLGGEKDEKTALALFEKAGDAGYWGGYNDLASEAEKRGDKAGQIKWLRKVAETHPLGAWLLAKTYRADKEYSQAMSWAHKGARTGSVMSMKFLAEMYEAGEGASSADKVEAYKWYRLMAWMGDYGATVKIKELDAALSPADRAEGLRRAKEMEFVPYPTGKPYPRPAGAKPAPAPAPAEYSPAVAAAPARLPERPDDFALIVGIEKYRGLPPADYAESDAAAMRERLVALGVPERNAVSLSGADATRSKLDAYLREWLPRNARKGGRVFFYFSGHGSPDAATGQAYLVPSDGDPAFLKSTAYPLQDLYAALDALPAQQVVVALDACFSGAGGRSVLAKGTRPLVTKTDVAPRGANPHLLVFAAAAGDQTTGVLDDQRQGAFTHFLLQGLEGAAKDAQGRITAGSLSAYVSPKVEDAARRQNREQTPKMTGDAATVLFSLP